MPWPSWSSTRATVAAGHGRALLDAVLAEGARSVWAHGMLPAADALARAAGLEVTRSLHRDDATTDVLPTRRIPLCRRASRCVPSSPVATTRPGCALNAAAFARHPEQGRLTVADLHERMAQPWFDPAGLLLVVDDATGSVVAFHWTKVEPGSRPIGEVYVVGVDPAHQGRGLGGPVTRLGLAHLRPAGARRGRALRRRRQHGGPTHLRPARFRRRRQRSTGSTRRRPPAT